MFSNIMNIFQGIFMIISAAICIAFLVAVHGRMDEVIMRTIVVMKAKIGNKKILESIIEMKNYLKKRIANIIFIFY